MDRDDDAEPTRYRRPCLRRTQPIRRAATLFGPPKEPEPGTAPEPAPRASGASSAASAPSSGAADPVAEGVAAGYRVIEDYIEAGRAAARRTAGPKAASADREHGPAVRDERLLQYAADLAATGLELVEMLTLGRAATPAQQGAGCGPFASHRPNPSHHGDPPGAGRAAGMPFEHSARVSGAIELRSAQNTLRVRWELDPAAAGTRLQVEPLRARSEGLPALAGVSIAWPAGGEPPCVSLPLGSAIAASDYRGQVLDADRGAVVGTLDVRVVETLAAE